MTNLENRSMEWQQTTQTFHGAGEKGGNEVSERGDDYTYRSECGGATRAEVDLGIDAGEKRKSRQQRLGEVRRNSFTCDRRVIEMRRGGKSCERLS